MNVKWGAIQCMLQTTFSCDVYEQLKQRKIAVKQQSTTNLRANQITIYKIHGFTTGIRFILHMMMDTASHPSEWICMCCCNKNVAHVFNNPVQYIVVIGQTTKQSVAFCLQQLKSNLLFYSECG